MLPETVEESHKLIESLRRENGDWRNKLRRYEEVFQDFAPPEQEFLLGLVRTLDKDPSKGAIMARDLAFQMLGNPEAFLEGLDLPVPAAPAEDDTTTPEDEDEEAEVAGLTAEQLQAVLDERETKAAAAAAKAAEEAAIEEIFQEIEAAGFERGTEGFMTILSLAQSQAAVGKDVDFNKLAPTVHQIVGTEAPSPDGDTEEESANDDSIEGATDTQVIDTEPEGSGKPHVSTAGAGGAGGAPAEKVDENWAKTAIAEGRNPLEVARERAERRLAGDLV